MIVMILAGIAPLDPRQRLEGDLALSTVLVDFCHA
jgi:hypothetical protein